MKIRDLKLRTKIMLLYMVLSAVLLLIVLPLVYFIAVYSLDMTLTANMQTSMDSVAACLYEADGEIYVDTDSAMPELVGSGIYIQVLNADGETVYLSLEAEWGFEWLLVNEDPEEIAKDWTQLSADYTVGSQTVTVNALGNVYYNDFVEFLLWILIGLGVLFMILAMFGSFIIAKRALRPIQRITETARTVAASDRSRRIEGITANDEVGQLAHTFNEMLDELEVSFQRERQFTSDVSHELRTPLTVIETCTDDALHTRDVEIMRDNLYAIKRENQRMTRMISQLLFLSRGYEGRLRFEPETIGVRETAESVIDVFRSDAEARNIRIVDDIPEGLEIRADQSLFSQLLVNLIENAVKYGRDGGFVRLTAEENGEKIELFVSDDGIGIAEDQLPHIFERFYRADRARDRSGQGLGLSIALQIVELHGGTIAAESALGEGTTFHITLPKT